MWASGETDEPKKFSSGAWLLRASGEIDERRCLATWLTFKGGSCASPQGRRRRWWMRVSARAR
jgi:hypothetical protein